LLYTYIISPLSAIICCFIVSLAHGMLIPSRVTFLHLPFLAARIRCSSVVVVEVIGGIQRRVPFGVASSSSQLRATSSATITITSNATFSSTTTTTTTMMSSSSSSNNNNNNNKSLKPTLTPAFPWCYTARMDPHTQQVITEHVAGDDVLLDSVSSVPPSWYRSMQNRSALDVTTSPDWMEFIELSEQRSLDSGGAGAYDTFRCDLIVGESAGITTTLSSEDDSDWLMSHRWRVWGQDFHLQRLQESYRSIAVPDESQQQQQHSSIQRALEQSHQIVKALLQQVERSERLTARGLPPSQSAWEDDVSIQIVRLTLLWSPAQQPAEQDTDMEMIVVRGHACSSAKPMGVHRPVSPIVVSVAAKQKPPASAAAATSSVAVAVDTSMPSRVRDPQHKVASWTRLRKQMEQPETYKPHGVAEVLMVRPLPPSSSDHGSTESADDVEVLEGLSSNVFVVYQDGTLRTAHDGVLYGYARHLVLQCASSCGLRYDPTLPIVLQDARRGLWKEAFITSSSRLVYPISKVLVHTDQDMKFEEYWRDPVLCRSSDGDDNHHHPNGRSQDHGAADAEKPKWQQLLDKILHMGGYPRYC